jgi:hypothetical protein
LYFLFVLRQLVREWGRLPAPLLTHLLFFFDRPRNCSSSKSLSTLPHSKPTTRSLLPFPTPGVVLYVLYKFEKRQGGGALLVAYALGRKEGSRLTRKQQTARLVKKEAYCLLLAPLCAANLPPQAAARHEDARPEIKQRGTVGNDEGHRKKNMENKENRNEKEES